jgi:hypothetical protein
VAFFKVLSTDEKKSDLIGNIQKIIFNIVPIH